MGRRRRNFLVLAAIGVFISISMSFLIGSISPELGNQETSSYDQFIQEVQSRKVIRVAISRDRAVAKATRQDGSQFTVNLPSAPGLIDVLVKNNVSISIQNQIDTQPAQFFLKTSLLLLPLVIVTLLWLWALIDCIMNESSEGNIKAVWVVIIISTVWIGALFYYLIRKPTRFEELGR